MSPVLVSVFFSQSNTNFSNAWSGGEARSKPKSRTMISSAAWLFAALRAISSRVFWSAARTAAQRSAVGESSLLARRLESSTLIDRVRCRTRRLLGESQENGRVLPDQRERALQDGGR